MSQSLLKLLSEGNYKLSREESRITSLALGFRWLKFSVINSTHITQACSGQGFYCLMTDLVALNWHSSGSYYKSPSWLLVPSKLHGH